MSNTKLTMTQMLLKALEMKLDAEGLPAVSRATGVAKPVIWRFVRGQQSLNLKTVEKLADYCGLELKPRS
jgi:hypothetical protein